MKQIKDMDLEEFDDWASGRILKGFIEDGGKGLKNAVWSIRQAHFQWLEEQYTFKVKRKCK